MASKKTSFIMLLWYHFLAITMLTQYCHGNPNVLCRKKEREALLTFKQGIKDPSNRLSSWTGEECCMWNGIGCDNITGHVIQLNLQNPSDESALYGNISDSLLQLKHLRYLDLSYNHFEDDHFPSFFPYLQNLRYLKLSYAGRFRGGNPYQLGNLSNLHYLDIRGLSGLDIDNLNWLSHLSLLEFLDMSGVNLNKASNWLQVMNTLPSLTEVYLHSCLLDNWDPIPHVNFSSLRVLDLSFNRFVSKLDWIRGLRSIDTLDLSSSGIDLGSINWLYNITTLKSLHLSYNQFQGVLPSAIGGLSQLLHLNLSFNNLEGVLPKSFANLCNLQRLDLSNNKIGGGLSEILGNGSACNGRSLEFINLAENQLSGALPDQLATRPTLSVLLLHSNLLSGPIPMSIGEALSSLRVLSVFDNQLNGTIPESIGKLSNLEELDISQNFIEGSVSNMLLSNLTRLKKLSASSNPITLQVRSNWVPPFQLETLKLGSWPLGPRFPAWLQSLINGLRVLDLSNTGISDVIPSWFWSQSSQFNLLDLSHNQIRGSIPSLSCGGEVYLDSNNFSGPVPNISSAIRYLDLSSNSFNGFSPIFCEAVGVFHLLSFLDLSTNLLSGELPDCWTKYILLEELYLGNNNLTGNIPSSMGSIPSLLSLSLHKNNLFGNLALSTLQNCTALELLDLSENHFSGDLPIWLGNRLFTLMVLVLHSNKFGGHIPLELCQQTSLQILDLANNNFSGSIPRCFGNFTAMMRQEGYERIFDFIPPKGGYSQKAFLVTKGMEYEYRNTLPLVISMDLSSNNLVGEIPEELTTLIGLRFLNFSHNQLHGKIPDKINAVKLLESLDVSMNQLTGVIPQSMANLTFLSQLNLSYNNLSGIIPSSTQLRSFSALSFIGNHDLCGAPLTTSCNGDDTPLVSTPSPNVEDEGSEDSGWIEMKWFYISMPLGFAVGFWAVIGPLAFRKDWRSAYFKFFDDIKYKLFGGV